MKSIFINLQLVLVLGLLTGLADAQKVGVLLSSDAGPYQEAFEGFKAISRHRIAGVQILQNNSQEWQEQVKRLRSVIEPDLVFVVGTSALDLVAGHIKTIPVVHALALNSFSSSFTGNRNIYGISMIPSAEQAMSLLKEMNPRIGRVGTIYDPSRSALLFLHSHSAFQKGNVQLIGREIRATGDIGTALKSLEGEVDILWLWPDERFLTEDVLQRLLIFSFETKIPVLGLSERHTEMGALLALSYGNAKDLGRQAGELANQLLSGTKFTPGTLTPPRQLRLTVNLRTARKLNTGLPKTLVDRAENAIKAPVYRDGDWWLFRTRTIHAGGGVRENYGRVVFENGKFESDDLRLLSGGDILGTPAFLPFPTFHFVDGGRRWLDFPLLPGKTWTFHYRRQRIGRVATQVGGTADVEVAGQALEEIDTPAGRLMALRLDRTDTVDGPGFLTYFYSPKTKSVIKAAAERRTGIFSPGSSWTEYRLDLIDYGHRGSAPKHVEGAPSK